MLMSVKHLSGFKIDAEDGEIGSVDSLLMDDQRWVVRYIVVETGNWLAHRKVLIAPSAGKNPDGESKRFPVRLTKKQVEESPEIDTDMPVSRKREIELYEHYKWTPYWVGTAAPFAPPFIPLSETPPEGAKDGNEDVENADPHLRSANEIVGYHIHASDGKIGHVEDFIVDTESWVIRYMVVDTRNWIPGKEVLIAPEWIQKVSWQGSMVSIQMTRNDVEKSPEYDSSAPINMEYEARLYDYYGKPKYWT